MSEPAQPSLTWVYEGVWGILSKVLCVPREAPQLPTIDREEITSRRPSPGFVRYLMLEWAIVMTILLLVTVGLSIVVIALAANENPAFGLLAIPLLGGFLTLALLGYLAIYLRYDTTWYVFSDRSMRLRRGIWLIRESTITYENIQNVKVSQGPLQRVFGIANVVVETAGGGGAAQGGGQGMHAGLIEGVAEAASIRDAIMAKVKLANTTGLGDEQDGDAQGSHRKSGAWTESQLAVLSEIRDLSARLS